ncbi:peptidylprolyl isomerase [Lacisediminimonas profundi]|uniref:peptidylprolyl isomerase n=1 Tax=Lacisediminimonas profundi TaxID=2603856 RepID=UPI00124B3E0A|nr:peptidylprolyl isomerase [Lacisediminimonas profundi]
MKQQSSSATAIRRSPRQPRRAPGGWLLAAAAILALPAVHAQTQGPAAAPARQNVQAVDSIVAVVNNEVITNRELEDRIKMVEARMRSQNVAMPPRAEFRKQLLERLIVDRAQMQLAKESGIRVDDQMLDRAVAGIAEQNKMNMQEFRNQLERDGMSFARFREDIREEITLQRLREREVDSKIQISESEIDNFMAESPATAEPTELNIAQILIRIPENASPEQISQRRERAEQAVQQLKGGADFAKVAATFSDSADALRGGEIGWRTPDRLPELFVDSMAKSKPGDIAAVKSANGFHILKLLGTRKAEAGTSGTSGGSVPAVVQTRARHILIKVNQVVSSTDARRKLAEVRERLANKAATFEEMARLYSNDSTASRGGDLGWVYPGDTVPEFERAMNALQPGDISEPIESQFGFHLIQVMERKRDDVSKERQRQAARQVLRERKAAEAQEEWLRQLRDRAYVEYRDDADGRR